MPAHILLLLLLSLFSSAPAYQAQPSRPSISMGSILIPRHASSAKDDAPAAPECSASAVSDFSSRMALPQWNISWTPTTFEESRQGPYLSFYPRAEFDQIPAGCDPAQWAYQRLLAAVALTVQMGLNYCHFRAPAYEAPEEVRMVCVSLNSTPASSSTHAHIHSSAEQDTADSGSRSAAGQDIHRADDNRHSRHTNSSSSSGKRNSGKDGSKGSNGSSGSLAGDSSCVWMKTSICNEQGLVHAVHPWRGLDCSNFVAWVYNFAFGYYPTTVIGESACHPTYAPGRLLHNVTTMHLDQLRPGDLVFGRQSWRPAGAPSAVRHVALWTGYTVDFENATSPFYNAMLLQNVAEVHRHVYAHCMAHQRALGRPVHVIADSNFAGPAYRPFCGPYLTTFSHARRIIIADSDSWPYTNSDSVAHWDDASKSCMSKWSLLGHSLQGVHADVSDRPSVGRRYGPFGHHGQHPPRPQHDRVYHEHGRSR